MRLTVLALLGFVAVATAASVQHSHPLFPSDVIRKFKQFQAKFGKKYADKAEEMHRLNIFVQNLQEIEHHNARRGVTYKKGINKFSDLTEKEFNDIYVSGYINLWKDGETSSSRKSNINIKDLPANVDWRDRGVITEPKDQGSCGSCWAFATIQQVESYLALETNGTVQDLSPQHLTSCMPNPMQCGGFGGCQGAIPQIAYSYIQQMGLLTEADYPYVSGQTGQTGTCNYDATNQIAAAYVRGYETLPHNELEPVMNHLANVGPLSIAVDASRWSSYSSGVFDDCDYSKNIMINHAVHLVGYGTDDNGVDYWLVRNSWGPNWGEDGYIKLLRESTVLCGKDYTPAMGSACQGDGNAVQKVCGMCGALFDTSYPIGTSVLSGIKP